MAFAEAMERERKSLCSPSASGLEPYHVFEGCICSRVVCENSAHSSRLGSKKTFPWASLLSLSISSSSPSTWCRHLRTMLLSNKLDGMQTFGRVLRGRWGQIHSHLSLLSAKSWFTGRNPVHDWALSALRAWHVPHVWRARRINVRGKGNSVTLARSIKVLFQNLVKLNFCIPFGTIARSMLCFDPSTPAILLHCLQLR